MSDLAPKKVLLVWNVIPEQVRFFLLDGKKAELALKCQNAYINSSEIEEDHPIHELNELLYDEEGDIVLEEINTDEPFQLTETVTVVIAGFIL